MSYESQAVEFKTTEALIFVKERDGSLRPIENYLDAHTFCFPHPPKVGDKIQVENTCYQITDMLVFFEFIGITDEEYSYGSGILKVIVEALQVD